MTNTVIAGLSFQLNFFNKINQEPFKITSVSQQPLTNIYTNKNDDGYIVNVLAHMPTDLTELKADSLYSGFYLDKHQKIYFNYNGIIKIHTSVENQNKGIILCRDFNIEYDSISNVPEVFDMYYFQIEYKILSQDTQSVEAIIVQDKNLDPETDRGTVTTVRKTP